MISRHPLWDEHDEEEDPKGERILDQGRLTFTTTPLDAEPWAVSRTQEDTLKPLLAALGLFVVCGALVFKMAWVVLAASIFTIIVVGLWLRPTEEDVSA